MAGDVGDKGDDGSGKMSSSNPRSVFNKLPISSSLYCDYPPICVLTVLVEPDTELKLDHALHVCEFLAESAWGSRKPQSALVRQSPALPKQVPGGDGSDGAVSA